MSKDIRPRIITGSAKGQKLEVPQRGTRPMTDRVKSALFSMIFEFIPDANVLDLYAGTGALGIECLSRGAKSAVFVDRSKYAVNAIKNNLKKSGMSSLAKVFKCSVSRFLGDFESFDLNISSFDLIFVTPPHADFKESIVERAGEYLQKDGLLIAEHPKTRKVNDNKILNLEKIEERNYGITSLSFYHLKP